MVSGTIKNAVNLQMLDNKWQIKKNQLEKKTPVSEMTKEERMLADLQEQAEKQWESNSHADTYNKLKSGGKLTPDEISYLEKNDPEALRKYREDQAEKEAYEKALKNCRTKEDVDRVKMTKLGDFASRAKKISTDPYIPIEKKLELMNQLNNKLCLVEEAHLEFIKSAQYKEMPTQEELKESEKEEYTELMEPGKESDVMDDDSVAESKEEEDFEDIDAFDERKEKKPTKVKKRDWNTKVSQKATGLGFRELFSEIKVFTVSAQKSSKLDINI